MYIYVINIYIYIYCGLYHIYLLFIFYYIFTQNQIAMHTYTCVYFGYDQNNVFSIFYNKNNNKKKRSKLSSECESRMSFFLIAECAYI